MGDPFTIGMMAVGTAASAGGGIMAAFGQKEAGAAAKRQAEYKAGIAEMNAKIARQNSDITLEASRFNIERQGNITSQTIGRQTSVQAASGFDINGSSATAVRESTRAVGMQDEMTINREAGTKALGFRNRAKTLDAEAVGLRMAGADAKDAADIAAMGTFAATAGSVAGKWTQASNAFGSAPSPGITTYDQNFNVSGWSA